MILESLEKLGLTNNEARVYTSLLQSNKTTASIMGKKLGIPRTTVHTTLQTLTEKWLVYEEQDASTTWYHANHPNSLLRIIEKEEFSLVSKKTTAKKLITNLSDYLTEDIYSKPRVLFFEGEENVLNMLYTYEKEWQKSLKSEDNICWWYQDHSFVEQYLPWLNHNWADIKKDEKIYLLSNASEIENNLWNAVKDREIRVLDEQYFDSTTWICGEYMIIINTHDTPHNALMIKNKIISKNMRNLFKTLWTVARVIE